MYTFTEREKLYTLWKNSPELALLHSYTCIGGVARDVPEGWLDRVTHFCDELPKAIDEVEKLLTRNRIFIDSTEGIGEISSEDAVAFGLTGPNLRASGVDLDLRKDKPYSGYENYDFDVPIGTRGDCYDRYLVRIEEVRQSIRIVNQVIEDFPSGAWYAEDAKDFCTAQRKDLEQYGRTHPKLHDCHRRPTNTSREVYFELKTPKELSDFTLFPKVVGFLTV